MCLVWVFRFLFPVEGTRRCRARGQERIWPKPIPPPPFSFHQGITSRQHRLGLSEKVISPPGSCLNPILFSSLLPLHMFLLLWGACRGSSHGKPSFPVGAGPAPGLACVFTPHDSHRALPEAGCKPALPKPIPLPGAPGAERDPPSTAAAPLPPPPGTGGRLSPSPHGDKTPFTFSPDTPLAVWVAFGCFTPPAPSLLQLNPPCTAQGR